MSYLKNSQDLINRFLTYVKTYSQSDSIQADKGIQPSTPQQNDMAALLNKEMKTLGLTEVQTTEYCYTYGFLPASPGFEDKPCICLLAHIDTVEEVSGKDVKPILHENYAGEKIHLPYGIILDPASDADLANAANTGDTIITSDGSTLLGADDKAGVAEIMTALEYLLKNPDVKHGPIEVIFSPDEETGHGMDHVPLNLIKSKFAYTVDGGNIGELEKECFNAFKSDVTFIGKSVHTGSARPNLVNAIVMASSFVTNLPRHEMPETTDGYMGFYGPMSIEGSIEKASVNLILRDFCKEGIEKRKNLVDKIATTVAESFGGKVEIVHTPQYVNMKENLDKNPFVVEKLVKAYENAGVTPLFVPIRGGTDGSRLTELGIPTPNIFTGGHSYHSRYEWASLKQMTVAVEVLLELIKEVSL